MNTFKTLPEPDATTGDRRISQMRNLCHFLDIFASGDPLMRARAQAHQERLRAEGYCGDEIIASAATALLVVLENEIEQRNVALQRLPAIWREPGLPEIAGRNEPMPEEA